jgi:hypothetical protein
MRRVTVGLVVALAGLILRFIVVADQWSGPSVPFLGWAVAMVSLLGGLCYVLTWSKLAMAFPASALTLVAVTYLVDLSPVKPALRAVSHIRVGMTEGQVRSILESSFPSDGRFKRPYFGRVENGVLGFALDPGDYRYNSAFVEVRFDSKKKCTSAEFLAD